MKVHSESFFDGKYWKLPICISKLLPHYEIPLAIVRGFLTKSFHPQYQQELLIRAGLLCSIRTNIFTSNAKDLVKAREFRLENTLHVLYLLI